MFPCQSGVNPCSDQEAGLVVHRRLFDCLVSVMARCCSCSISFPKCGQTKMVAADLASCSMARRCSQAVLVQGRARFRHCVLENDLVEAIIRLPTDNTGLSFTLWLRNTSYWSWSGIEMGLRCEHECQIVFASATAVFAKAWFAGNGRDPGSRGLSLV